MPKKQSLSTASSENGHGHQDDDVALGGVNKWARTTIFLTDALNANLECYALQSGESKGVIVRKALAAYLRDKGLTPGQKPRVTVSYDG